MKIEDRIDLRGLRLQSLSELLDLIDLCSPSQVVIGEDLVGHKQSVLLKAGHPLTKSAIRYLEENEKSEDSFVVQSTDSLLKTVRHEILQKGKIFVKSDRFRAVTMCEAAYRKEFWEELISVLNEEKIAFLLFTLTRFGKEEGAYRYQHLFSVAVLAYAIARFMDPAYATGEKAVQLIQAGLTHDLCLSNYLSRIGKGRAFVEEPEHQKEIGVHLRQWGMGDDVVQAVTNHHAYAKRGEYQSQVPENSDKLIFDALNTAECFATLRDLVPGRREDEATYLIAHLCEEGSLEKQTVKVLGTLIQSREIISDVERLSEIEKLCTRYKAAYVHPKVLHSIPTQVVCRKDVLRCPKFISGKSPLRVLANMSETSLTKDMLSLKPGEYGKCALTDEIERSNPQKSLEAE